MTKAGYQHRVVRADTGYVLLSNVALLPYTCIHTSVITVTIVSLSNTQSLPS